MMTRSVLGSARALVVQKYGGTSLATPELIARAARRIVASRSLGTDVIVVVSAMAGETDRLLSLASSTHAAGAGPRALPVASTREHDMVAAAGEQASAGLMAIALRAAGAEARAWLGHQLPIRTDSVFGAANIMSVDPMRLCATLDAGEIPVVAGFQGIDSCGSLTTLGRGGSDTTAVAVAAAVEATCEIYTDVDGVYTIDPRVSSRARPLPAVGYATMHALAASGAKVLETRSVDLARRYRVPVHVRSSLSSGDGTWVVGDDDERARGVIGVAIACNVGGDDSRSEVSVIGPNVVLDQQRVERALSAIRVKALESRSVPLGVAYVLRSQDAPEAARALHGLCGLEETPTSDDRPRRKHSMTQLRTRAEETERTRRWSRL